LKFYNFLTVEGRGIQSARRMLRMKSAFQQEAQLSQRDRATLCVINVSQSHSRSLKIIIDRNDVF